MSTVQNSIKIETELPAEGLGYIPFMRGLKGNRHQWGTASFIALLVAIAEAWYARHPDVPLAFGHISLKGGGDFWSEVKRGKLAHHQHKHGVEVDIRPLRKDKRPLPVTMNDPMFDPVLTRELIQLIRSMARVHRIFFNYRPFIQATLTSYAEGHGDHLHLWTEQEPQRAVLALGAHGADVRELQTLLAKLKLYTKRIDESFGRGTQQAVIAFQAAHDMIETGTADAAMQAALMQATN